MKGFLKDCYKNLIHLTLKLADISLPVVRNAVDAEL